ncbi:MAG: peptidase S41 [Crocinitomicaceae bacterium]|nr:peptidase S41 [Crocinitomicaceae bacterium]
MNKKKAKKTWIWLFPIAGLLAASAPLRENYFELSKQLEIMTAMFRELNIYYVDEIQPGQLMETGMDAMVESLDPYTIYYPESQVEDLRFMTTGEYGGIGASMQFINGRHLIVDILPDFPAARAGLKIGDELVAIDGQSLEGIDPDIVPEMLQGASGTSVDIQYLPNGFTTPLDLTVERDKIKLPAVPYREVIGDSTGYIILSAFTRGSSFELRQAIRHLKDSVGINQLVLDLRGNGGGLLQESISVVNLFVEKGQEVVSTRGKKKEWMKSYSTMADPLVPELPLAVLIDEKSASASEIVSGTLQDLDRAIIVGQESFGKGLVQQTKSLAYGTKLKVTVAKYYTASGRCIQRLDYSSKRGEDGSANAYSDSTRQIFYTRNGRPVTDGSGVQPDINVDVPYMSYVLEELYLNGTIFDFANAWSAQHDSIRPASTFSLQDVDWDEFVDFAVKHDSAAFESSTLNAFEQLESLARKEQFYASDSVTFDAFRSLLEPNVKRDLNRFREEITWALEEELVMRYYLQSGVIEWSIPRDSTLNKAVELMRSEAHEAILAGPNP